MAHNLLPRNRCRDCRKLNAHDTAQCFHCGSFNLSPVVRRQRLTRDCWRFYINYGQGWEHEITEYTRDAMKENRKAYRENCNYPLRIVRGRERIEPKEVQAPEGD